MQRRSPATYNGELLTTGALNNSAVGALGAQTPMEPAASAAPGAATGSPAAAAAAAAQPAAAVTQQAPQLPAAANKQLQRLALLTRKNLCELFVTKGQAADLLHLEVKLRGERRCWPPCC